jgi:hypothetical protein
MTCSLLVDLMTWAHLFSDSWGLLPDQPEQHHHQVNEPRHGTPPPPFPPSPSMDVDTDIVDSLKYYYHSTITIVPKMCFISVTTAFYFIYNELTVTYSLSSENTAVNFIIP